ncbi:MAG: hypothetical protein ACRBFS_24490 [Aureispira sp.]
MIKNFEPHATILWEEELNAVHIEWKKLYMPLERFVEICNAAVEVVIEKKATVWLGNQYNSEGVFNKEIKEAIAEGAEPMKQIGVNKLLTIMPKTMGLSSLNTKSWINGIKGNDGLDMAEFATLEECREWILANK